MAKLELYWSETALYQRNQIFSYWNQRNTNKSYSKRLLKLINERTRILQSFPKMGKKVNVENVRAIPIENFSLFYEIMDNEKLIILSFWDNRDDPNKLLKILINKSK